MRHAPPLGVRDVDHQPPRRSALDDRHGDGRSHLAAGVGFAGQRERDGRPGATSPGVGADPAREPVRLGQRGPDLVDRVGVLAAEHQEPAGVHLVPRFARHGRPSRRCTVRRAPRQEPTRYAVSHAAAAALSTTVPPPVRRPDAAQHRRKACGSAGSSSSSGSSSECSPRTSATTSRPEANCAQIGTVLLTVVAGPLNYFGLNPQIDCPSCHNPRTNRLARQRSPSPHGLGADEQQLLREQRRRAHTPMCSRTAPGRVTPSASHGGGWISRTAGRSPGGCALTR